MVLVGGATRLTESGLSITQWKPVTGVLPPLNAADWQAEFDRYRQIPQFARLNPDMTIEGFKTIFWWEWSHRLLARIVGAAFILPALWFWMRGAFKGALGRQVAVATGFLALEPIVGWWMVSSGLSERTEVAQDRLALHLLIAAATFGALIYRRSGLKRAGARARLARLLDLGGGLRGARLCPARPRRAGRGPARRADLRHLAADGLGLDPRRGLRLAELDARRSGDGAIRPPDDRLRRRRLRARPGDRGPAPGPPALRAAPAPRRASPRCRSRSASRRCSCPCRSPSRSPIRRPRSSCSASPSGIGGRRGWSVRRPRSRASWTRSRPPRAKSRQAGPKVDQEKPRKRAWIFLDFLRPIRAFSMGYEQSKANNCSARRKGDPRSYGFRVNSLRFAALRVGSLQIPTRGPVARGRTRRTAARRRRACIGCLAPRGGHHRKADAGRPHPISFALVLRASSDRGLEPCRRGQRRGLFAGRQAHPVVVDRQNAEALGRGDGRGDGRAAAA